MKKQIKAYYLPAINQSLLTEYLTDTCQCDGCISEEGEHSNEYHGCEVVVISREKKRDWRTGIEYPTVTWVFAEDVMTAVEDGAVVDSLSNEQNIDKALVIHERIHEDLRI